MFCFHLLKMILILLLLSILKKSCSEDAYKIPVIYKHIRQNLHRNWVFYIMQVQKICMREHLDVQKGQIMNIHIIASCSKQYFRLTFRCVPNSSNDGFTESKYTHRKPLGSFCDGSVGGYRFRIPMVWSIEVVFMRDIFQKVFEYRGIQTIDIKAFRKIGLNVTFTEFKLNDFTPSMNTYNKMPQCLNE